MNSAVSEELVLEMCPVTGTPKANNFPLETVKVEKI